MAAARSKNILGKSDDSQNLDKREVRSHAILESLRQAGSVSVEALSEQHGVSVVTIRRDLDILEQQGLLQRTHGGAVTIGPLFYEPFRNNRSFFDQIEKLADEKKRIGRAAAAMIREGETIAITPGTTAVEVIRGLPLNKNLTVVTNTVNIAMELSKRKDVKVFVTGGHLRGDWFSLVGPTGINSLQNMLISTLFLGADGIDAQWGPSCYSADEAELNAALVRQSRRIIGVVDHTKFGMMANWKICETPRLDLIVTDSLATEEAINPFVQMGIKVVKA